jgi:hypothetical protein
MEEEVAKSVANAIGGTAANGGAAEGRHAPGAAAAPAARGRGPAPAQVKAQPAAAKAPAERGSHGPEETPPHAATPARTAATQRPEHDDQPGAAAGGPSGD